MNVRTTRPAAFTLIELLIVVAIIAILAAIAVPNFLEAQVRAKVSRVNSDHRVMAMGLESYYVDHNEYPARFPGAATAMNPVHLSTPIAYVARGHIRDVFAYPVSSWEFGNNLFLYGCRIEGICRYQQSSFDKFNAYTMWSVGPDRLGDTGSYRGLKTIEANEGCLVSNSCNGSAGWLNHSSYNGMRYDPSNGTMSKGDIYRFSGLAESGPRDF